MISYGQSPNSNNPNLVAWVENIKTKERFMVSTIKNPYGVYETMVVRAPNAFIASLKCFFFRFVFVINSPSLQEASNAHIRTAELFEQLNPRDLIKKYKTRGKVGMQFFVGEETDQ